MTTKQQVALHLHLIDLRLALGILERAEKTATELTAGADEISGIALRAGIYQGAATSARDDLRKAIQKFVERFPKAEWP